jgi:hypothetical protein
LQGIVKADAAIPLTPVRPSIDPKNLQGIVKADATIPLTPVRPSIDPKILQGIVKADATIPLTPVRPSIDPKILQGIVKADAAIPPTQAQVIDPEILRKLVEINVSLPPAISLTDQPLGIPDSSQGETGSGPSIKSKHQFNSGFQTLWKKYLFAFKNQNSKIPGSSEIADENMRTKNAPKAMYENTHNDYFLAPLIQANARISELSQSNAKLTEEYTKLSQLLSIREGTILQLSNLLDGIFPEMQEKILLINREVVESSQLRDTEKNQKIIDNLIAFLTKVVMEKKEIMTTYINHGQVGAMGENSRSDHNTFIQEAKKTLNELPLDTSALESLQKLADYLVANSFDDVSKSSLFQATSTLYELKENAEKQDLDGQAKAVSKWRQWLDSVSGNTLKALSVIADSLGVALPVIKLLGMPVP